ncbi:hypothetical protein ACFY4C_34075 [Actinomadura viridis]|uniref:hypothetical protein n=1 Tax=Actinomadura viridis TaxID=58110 RepID=UPI00368BC84A
MIMVDGGRVEIWTDGTLVVQACEEAGTVRVVRDFDVIGEAKPEHPLGWETPLAVDVEADRIWAGHRLQEFRLSDLSPVTVHEGVVWRVAALGGGRLAAVLPPVDGVCRLAVGRPGAWEREVVLDDLGDAVPGLAATSQEPFSRAIGDPTLTVTENGLVVADGRRGVVAHFTADLEPLGLWHSGGCDETELIGYATRRGVLVTARWAARESHVGLLTADGPEHLCDGNGVFAVPATGGRFWMAGWFEVALVTYDGETVASVQGPSGMARAVHASGNRCAIGGAGFLSIAVAAGDEVTLRAVGVEDKVDL